LCPSDEIPEEALELEGRLLTTQQLFREVNERIAGVWDVDEMHVLCECGADECTTLLAVRAEDYRAMRRVPTRFLVRTGHEARSTERVVASHDGYVVVEKFGSAGPAVARERRAPE